jgi:probable addiction module antidote protein
MGCRVKPGNDDQIAIREDDMARKTRRWDAAETLKTKEDIAAYLDAVLEDGDPDLLKAALGDIARAKGMSEIAQAAGVGRTNLYKALSPDGNPEFATVAKVLRALGLRLTVAA